jgi:hypothetical protein
LAGDVSFDAILSPTALDVGNLAWSASGGSAFAPVEVQEWVAQETKITIIHIHPRVIIA